MKKIFYIIIAISFACLMHGCGLDNYDQPESRLKGKITYNGKALDLRHSSIVVDLYQDSYELGNTIDVFIAQDGTFSAMLFDGDYRMVARDNSGPWVNDLKPLEFSVRGNTEIEFKVTPLFLLSNVKIAAVSNTVTATCTITKSGGEKVLGELTLYIGKTAFVDDRDPNKVASANSQSTTVGANTVSIDITALSAKYPALYARLGLKIAGVDERIYSNIVKIK